MPGVEVLVSSPSMEVIERQAEVAQDAMECAGRNLAPVPWNCCAPAGTRDAVPVVARTRAYQLNAQLAQRSA